MNNFLVTERGSFIVAGAFFLFFFIFAATLGVDLSRYYMLRQEVQSVADNAARAGGQALNQYRDEPDEALVYDAVLDYIASSQGEGRLGFYERHAPDDVDGIFLEYFTSETNGVVEEYYRVGVVTYGVFNPHFWPSALFGGSDVVVFTHAAVAEIHPQKIYRTLHTIADCGVFAGGAMDLSGNNFDASGANFCGAGDIDGSRSQSGVMGNVHLPSGANFSPPGGGAGTVTSDDLERSAPQFPAGDPTDYTVDLNNFDDWAETPDCPQGKALRPTDGSDTDVTWEDGSPVCVQKDQHGYSITDNDGGQIQRADGSSVTIYSDADFVFEGNGNGLLGGLYAEGGIRVEGNNYEFEGDPDKFGGLALWGEGDVEAEADVDFERNNIEIKGLAGSSGDFNFGSMGGGTGPILRGLLVAGGDFNLPSNSDAAEITLDEEYVDTDFLDAGDWEKMIQEELERPLYSDVTVRIVS